MKTARRAPRAAHPYFMLLDAMGDGAALLDERGAILFGNQRFQTIAGAPIDALAGTPLKRLVTAGQRARFAKFLRDGAQQKTTQEFMLLPDKGSPTPVSIALSALSLSSKPGPGRTQARDRGVLIAVLTDVTERTLAEATRSALLKRLISAEDDERRRIARELHDETGQALTALLVGLRTISHMSAPEEVRSLALHLREIGARTLDDVGRLARGLHPVVLDDDGLAAAARRYVKDYSRLFGTPVRFAAGELDKPRLPPLAAATVYRILQESLTNVARHAHATKVLVQLTRADAGIELIVQDNGVGFSERPDTSPVRGLGLRGMRERVALLGGSLAIASMPAHGTTVRAQVPVESRNGRSKS